MTSVWAPRFTIDTAKVLNLLTGDRFYSSNDAALREAVVNSIDAITRRAAQEPKIKPRIEVIYDDDASTVTVSDNGAGMDHEVVDSLFATIGASASQLAETALGSAQASIGEFGIGVVSYFLIADVFQVFTKQGDQDPIGLEFSKQMLDGQTPAKLIKAPREETGTSVVFFVKHPAIYQRLIERFAYWFRMVDGLTARRLPSDADVPQGSVSTGVERLRVETPEWIEQARIGPLRAGWGEIGAIRGSALVDVLYRGVFVDQVEVPRLWALSGAIHVHPRHFQPRLNREGFVGGEIKEEVSRFLQSVHPLAIDRALQLALKPDEKRDPNRLLSLWLAVPRGGAYADVASRWDKAMASKPTIRLLTATDELISIAELQRRAFDRLYLAPDTLNSPVAASAVRVLRARGEAVIQGLTPDAAWLPGSSFVARSTAFFLDMFLDKLPEITRIEAVADQVVSEEALTFVYDASPVVKLVQLGTKGDPTLVVGKEVWLNIDRAEAKSILLETCDRNDGHAGFLLAVLHHVPGALTQIVPLLELAEALPQRLGLVKRQYLRGLVQ